MARAKLLFLEPVYYSLTTEITKCFSDPKIIFSNLFKFYNFD
jgi:hypothetical protein